MPANRHSLGLCVFLGAFDIRILGVAMLGLVCVAAAAAITGARINTSYSLPLGIYVRTDDSHAELIEFCPTQPFAEESSERGYVKHLAATPMWA